MTPFGRVAACIDEDRLWQRHEDLARFGATERGGVNRQALSEADFAAQRQLIAWAQALDLSPSSDAAGNLFLRMEGRDNSLSPVLSGSHIDSQPTGGKYDGAFGVLAALEAVAAMRAAHVQPLRPLDIVAWMNEEGSRFAPGMMGSEAFAGVRPLQAILDVRDGEGVSVANALEHRLVLPQRPLGFPVAAFIEAHIEQGPELEITQRQIGVVTGIQGKKTFSISILGEEGHAGTTPRRIRKDALASAAGIIHALHREIRDDADQVRFTVGRLTVVPNAPSVIPGRVTFSVDLRHPLQSSLEAFGKRLVEIVENSAAPCTATIERLVDAPSLVFPAAIQDLIKDSASKLGISNMDMPSAAGHDARNVHAVAPAGMIFIPCEKGISHNEAEAVSRADLAAGARVLAEVLAQLTDMVQI